MPAKVKRPVVLKPRLRVLCGKDIALGPGKVELLAHLDDTGSIAEAAKRMDMSYMRAWTLLQQMEGCFKEPLVERQRGGAERGGVTLTDTGKRALELYQTMEMAADKAVQPAFAKLKELMHGG
jgi:molybdate transport system regulatory protein